MVKRNNRCNGRPYTLTVDNIAKMGDAAATISHELHRNQYIHGYRPSDTASDWKRRQIKVRVTNPASGDVQMQASYTRGYVIPKEK